MSVTSKLLAAHHVPHGFTGKLDPTPDCVSLKQIHSADVLNFDTIKNKTTEGDGIFSKTESTIAVKTADCIPLLITNKNRDFALAIHAGWRGFTKGILANGIKRIAENNFSLSDLLAVIGPCLCAKHFEVGPEVVTAFKEPQLQFNTFQFKKFITAGQSNRSHIDLTQAMVIHLENFGVASKNIDALNICTFCDGSFYSYRRDGKLAGSNWAWITS